MSHKLGILGKAFSGKSTLISLLAGHKDPSSSFQGETPGIRVTKLYWPAKIGRQNFLFDLEFWDGGDAASKKYSHILPVSLTIVKFV